MVDASVGTPVDPMPRVVLGALADAAPGATGYPATIGSPRSARRRRVGRAPLRLHAHRRRRDRVHRHQGSWWRRCPACCRCATRRATPCCTPAVAYPTYEMGALLAGLRAVPVPVDDEWHLDLGRVDPADAERALVLWLNDPSNPTGAVATPARDGRAVEWARARGIVVASDECYAEFTYDADGAPAAPVTALDAGTDGVLAVHSLSKRSNMAGLRAGFVAGDRDAGRLPRRDAQARRADDAGV